MDTIGPISKTVEDCAITFRAIAGHDPRDQYTWPTPVPDYRQSLDGDVRGMRIGIIKERADSQDVEPDIKEAVNRAISLLERMGASIEEVSIPMIDYSTVIFQAISRMEAANVHGAWIRERLNDFPHGIRVRHLWGSILPAQAYYKGLKLRAMLREQVLQALANVDVIHAANVPRSGAKNSIRRAAASHQRKGESRVLRPQHLYIDRQRGQHPGHVGPLRFHIFPARPADRPPNLRQAFR